VVAEQATADDSRKITANGGIRLIIDKLSGWTTDLPAGEQKANLVWHSA
jgi:hypothetical protein